MQCDKITYDSYDEATEAIRGLAHRTRHKYKSYRCRLCGGIHIQTLGKHVLKRKNKIDKYVKKPTDVYYHYTVKKKKFKQPKILSPPKLPNLYPQRLLTPLQTEILKHIVQYGKQINL